MTRQRGFTLIEVIVAIVIFAFVTLGGLAFYSLGGSAMTRAKEQSYALTIAKDQIAWCKVKGYNTIPASFSGDVVVRDLELRYTYRFMSTPKTDPFGTVKPANLTNDGYKVVSVTVTWTSNVDNVARSLDLHSIVTPSPYHP